MIFCKAIAGFVSQLFDTEKGEFVSQEFVAGDQVDWIGLDGENVLIEDLPFDPAKVYLEMNMKQPSRTNCRIREDILASGESIPTKDGGWLNEDTLWDGILYDDKDEFNTELQDADGNTVAWVNSMDIEWI